MLLAVAGTPPSMFSSWFFTGFHRSFAFPYSQADVHIAKFNHYSIAGSNAQKEVTFPINHNWLCIN